MNVNDSKRESFGESGGDTGEQVIVLESVGGGGTWGSITGTLSAQTDLQAALDLKANASSLSAYALIGQAFYLGTTSIAINRTSGAIALTGITSIDGAAATVSNATFTTALTVNTGTLTLTANSANNSVLTIGAGAVSVSGVNTGDNATNSQYSGLAASKADVGQTFYIGTTQVAINRASASLTLAGIALTTPNIGTPSAAVLTNASGTAASLTAGLATSLVGGSGGTIPYQSAAGTTAMLANGTAGYLLQSNGTTLAPTWVVAPTGLSWGTTVAAGSGVALTLTSADLSGANAFASFVHTASGTLTANTTTQNTQSTSRTYTLTSGSVTDNFIGSLFSRTNITTGAGGTLLAQGSVVNVTGTDTQTAGTLTPSYDLVKLQPSLLSTGSSLNIQVANSTSAPTNGHIYALLWNTQAVAHTLMTLDLWTSARANIGLQINAAGGSTTQSGIVVAKAATGTGKGILITSTLATSATVEDIIGIEMTNAGDTGRAFLYFRNSTNVSNGKVINANMGRKFLQSETNNGYIDIDSPRWPNGNNQVWYFFSGNKTLSGGTNSPTLGMYIGIVYTASEFTGTAPVIWVDSTLSTNNMPLTRGLVLDHVTSSSTVTNPLVSDFSQITRKRTNTHTSSTVAESYNTLTISDTSVQNGAGGTFTNAGAVIKAVTVATQTAGTLTHTKDVYNATQPATVTTGKIFTGVVGATERFKVHPMVANSGTNNAYLFDTTTALDTNTTLAIFANAGTTKVTIDNAGNYVSTGSLKTSAPNGGTAGAWKHGVYVGTGTSVFRTDAYVELDIGGTLYKLALCTNA